MMSGVAEAKRGTGGSWELVQAGLSTLFLLIDTRRTQPELWYLKQSKESQLEVPGTRTKPLVHLLMHILICSFIHSALTLCQVLCT